jgi:hypothetical protein
MYVYIYSMFFGVTINSVYAINSWYGISRRPRIPNHRPCAEADEVSLDPRSCAPMSSPSLQLITVAQSSTAPNSVYCFKAIKCRETTEYQTSHLNKLLMIQHRLRAGYSPSCNPPSPCHGRKHCCQCFFLGLQHCSLRLTMPCCWRPVWGQSLLKGGVPQPLYLAKSRVELANLVVALSIAAWAVAGCPSAAAPVSPCCWWRPTLHSIFKLAYSSLKVCHLRCRPSRENQAWGASHKKCTAFQPVSCSPSQSIREGASSALPLCVPSLHFHPRLLV